MLVIVKIGTNSELSEQRNFQLKPSHGCISVVNPRKSQKGVLSTENFRKSL